MTSGIHYKEILFLILIDLLGMLLVIFLPAFSHMLSFPLYLIDPLRLIVISALIFTNKNNALALAAVLPLVSFAISSHPYLIKSLLISIELLLNVYFVLVFYSKIKNIFLLIFTGIVLSKIFYYFLKFILIQTSILDGELISTSFEIQLIAAFFLCLFAFIFKNNFYRNISV